MEVTLEHRHACRCLHVLEVFDSFDSFVALAATRNAIM